MDPIVYKNNNILQRQRIYQSDLRPVYQRLPRSGLYMGIFQIFFWAGIGGITVGAFNMITLDLLS
ncbi:hypothetical protein MGL_1175 [Malassezia globosa CBS 7966]|uniref:Uncharacterized protein n=1 Tax=Malassezia globosa (strain ATCC MYA-4612 / CBS 7966) TaxID=425265 RepID=A8PWP8_MALGO|nr:uncharacterized protein MGL_1175 [Malassezia globosa CBS 7966]EDP44693.1 hypothetical protein MGL_1175 [Malassezia globosa CBS 7966]